MDEFDVFMDEVNRRVSLCSIASVCVPLVFLWLGRDCCIVMGVCSSCMTCSHLSLIGLMYTRESHTWLNVLEICHGQSKDNMQIH